MAYVAVQTYTTGQIVTAADLNADLRDNMAETAAAKVTTAGDMVIASAAYTLKRVALGAALTVWRVNSGATDAEWAAGYLTRHQIDIRRAMRP